MVAAVRVLIGTARFLLVPHRPTSFDVNPDWPHTVRVVWDVVPGAEIKRTELHERFGGPRQGGIAGSAQSPNVMLFTSESGGEHGYVDGWADGGIFKYSGEGQKGDQTFSRGNKAVRDHALDGKALRLFEGTSGVVRYVGEFTLADPPFQTIKALETNGGPLRDVIVFNLKKVELPPEKQLVAVYVGRASEPNLTHSTTQTSVKWGWKVHQDEYPLIQPGNLVLFGMRYTGGSPRVQSDEYKSHRLDRVVLARATTKVHAESDPYWPDESDEVTYPWRLGFEVIEERNNQAIAELDNEFGGAVAEGLRLSGIKQGRGELVTISESQPSPPDIEPAPFHEVADEFAQSLSASGRDYGSRHKSLTNSFLASLATKRFLILTGLSGSGKTQLALGFGQWLGREQTLVVPVRPDWTSPEALLGFENALSKPDDEQRYAWNAPAALRFMLQAHRDPSKPHLLILDEMNLAHVERYFADLLSGIESAEAVLPNLELGPDGLWRQAAGPATVPMPENLFVVGTVNVDETTYMFSPKVLDRANTIEFRVDTDDLRIDAGPLTPVPAAELALVAGFAAAAATQPELAGDVDFVNAIKEVHQLLARYDREFGHRTFLEARQFAVHLSAAGEHDPWTGIDLALLQKVLPKLHGSRSELTDLLDALGRWCFLGPGSDVTPAFESAEPPSSGTPVLPRSFDKIHRMAKRLRTNHFVSFAE